MGRGVCNNFYLNSYASAFSDEECKLPIIPQTTILSVVCMSLQANKIKDTLRNLDIGAGSQETLQNVKLFSLELLHEDFKITPGGLFTLDLSLVYVSLIANFELIQIAIEKYNPVIVMLSETHVTEEILDSEISIKGYNILRCNSYSRHTGGVIMYVKLGVDILEKAHGY
ncbi:7tm Chemosensory receptor [Popillia japonica]|uniref:7tm Chemosensory receptor n=1 Tax=Popillia japonica TaxID=7064 RepID=A0AAW1NL05_POPJA